MSQMIPKYFAHRILTDALSAIFPLRQVKEIMSHVPLPTDYEANVRYLLDLVPIINSDNRYHLCVVNRRANHWAMFVLTPYGTIRTSELAYAFGIPYEEVNDSMTFRDINDIIERLDEAGFSSQVIVNAFIDDNDRSV